LREDMRREIKALQRQLGITTVFVTHDQEEALTMADRVVVMNKGAIEQVGAPSEVYEMPANRFVLSFVGFSNFLQANEIGDAGDGLCCQVAGTRCRLGHRSIPGKGTGPDGELAIRPERIRIVAGGRAEADSNRIEGTILGIVYEGAMLTYDVVLIDGQRVLVREPNAGSAETSGRNTGQRVEVAWNPNDAVLVR